MGHYEHAEYYATVEIDTEKDVEFKDSSEDDVMGYVDGLLDKFTESDLDYVKRTTDLEDSWAFPYSDYRKATSSSSKPTSNKRG